MIALRSSQLLATAILLVAATSAQKSLPELAKRARTITVIVVTGPTSGGGWMPDAARAKKQVEEALSKWGRFTLVANPTNADLVLVVEERHSGTAHIGTVMQNSAGGTYSETTKGILSDVLALYPGGRSPNTSEPPIWSHTETGGFSWPAKRAIAKFRKDMEAAQSSARTEPDPHDMEMRVASKVNQICRQRGLSDSVASDYAKKIWSQISGDRYMMNRVASNDYADVTRLLESLLASQASSN